VALNKLERAKVPSAIGPRRHCLHIQYGVTFYSSSLPVHLQLVPSRMDATWSWTRVKGRQSPDHIAKTPCPTNELTYQSGRPHCKIR